MSTLTQLVVFTLDDRRYALPLAAVGRIIPAVEVTPLPHAPATVWGVINVAGEVVPVFNTRRRFQAPERGVVPADQFLLARTARRAVALVVDDVRGVLEVADDLVIAAAVVPGVEAVRGVVKLSDGLVLIHDLDRFLSLDEARALDAALAEEVPHGP